MKLKVAVLLVAVLIASFVTYRLLDERARSREIQEALAHASALEADQRYSEAIMVYDGALGLDVDSSERATLRFRLANALIEGNDLNRALEVLQMLTDEDVAAQRIDVTRLYLELGDRYMKEGNRSLAKVAYRMGHGIALSGPRVTEFAERMQQFIDEG